MRNTVEYLWKEILNNEEIDVNASFFENGGDSLKAMKMLQRLDEEHNIKMDMMSFFQKPTIDNICQCFEN